MARRTLIVIGLTFLFAAALLPRTSSAANYYACDCQSGAQSGCVAGNDSNAGTSPTAAFRTVERLLQVSGGSSCGDTFNVCEGGVWTMSGGGRDLSNANDCRANPRQFRAYDPTGNMSQRPRLVANTSVIALTIGGFQSGNARGLVVRDMEFRMPAPIRGSKGFFINGAGSGIVIDNVIVDGFDPCVETGGMGAGRTQWTIQNSIFRNCSGQGIIGGVASGSQFIGNIIENSACRLDPSSCGFQHSFYWGTNTSITGLVFRGNTIRGSNKANGACSGNPVSIRGANGLIFEDNVLDMRDTGGTRNSTAPCSAVRFNQNGGNTDGSEGCLNCVIRRNKVIDADLGLDLNGARNTVIENNVIAHTGPQSNWCIGISSTDGGPSSGGGTEDQTADAVTVRNNSIFIEKPAGTGNCQGVRLTMSQGSNHTMYSNAVHISTPRTNSRCYAYQDGTRYSEDNNLCFFSQTAGTYAEIGSGARTLEQVQQAMGGCPGDGNGCASRMGNPQFASPRSPSFDLSILQSSIARDTGNAQRSAQSDFARAARPIGSGFDVGAFEFGGSTVTALEPPTLLSP